MLVIALVMMEVGLLFSYSRGAWLGLTLAAIALPLGVSEAGLPIGGQSSAELPNDHLQYAITWYGFAVTLLVIYFVYHYRKPEP